MNNFRIGTITIVAVASLLAGCASGYSTFYRPVPGATPATISAQRVAPPPEIPAIERAQPGDSQVILDAYAKRGYVMIGNSIFNSGRPETEDSAIRQGQAVGADLVLVLNPKYTGTITSSIPITTPTSTTSYSTGTATAYSAGGTVTARGSGTTTTYGTTTNYIPISVQRSDFGAVFFIKQKFGLGLFIRDLNDQERQDLQTNKGVVARVVVDETPAFNADILVGDIIATVDGVGVSGTKSYTELLRARAGKLVSLGIIRRGQRMEKSVQLSN